MNESQALRQEIAQLRSAVEQANDFASGLLRVLRDVLPPLLRAHPEIAATLAPDWQEARQQFLETTAESAQAERFDESAEFLEPRKILFELFALNGVWPRRA